MGERMENGNGQVAGGGAKGGVTAGEAKERLSEVLFALSVFFGLLHFVGIAGQVAVMFLHTAFGIDASVPLRSSTLMGNIYLGFLGAYVCRKEYMRWLKAADAEVLPRYVLLKMTRGEVIIVLWAVLTGITVFLWGLSYINEVPNQLLYTMGEVLALWVGTDVSKFFTAKTGAAKRETDSQVADFGDAAVEYAKAHAGIDNNDCQREYGLSQDQASRLLGKLVKAGRLKPRGDTWHRRYYAD
jgi:hypothetical protein